jgi:hypothetical protein
VQPQKPIPLNILLEINSTVTQSVVMRESMPRRLWTGGGQAHLTAVFPRNPQPHFLSSKRIFLERMIEEGM